MQEGTQKCAARVGNILDPNEFLMVLGGDCAILIGILGAVANKNIDAGLVFFDGHADFHNTHSSVTGEAADFELAFLTGRCPVEITHLFSKYPLITDADVVAYGMQEPDHIADSNI